MKLPHAAAGHTVIHILLLEDEQASVERIKAVLTAGGLTFHMAAIATLADLQSAVRSQLFDVILADYRLLELMDSAAAIQKLHVLWPTAPLIVLSAVLGEERAVNALKQGAADYVIKQRLERLLPAIEAAIAPPRPQEDDLAIAALKTSEARFRTSIETMLDCYGIYTSVRDDRGQIIDFRVDYVNEAACIANMMPREAQLGHRLCEILPAHRESGLLDEYRQVVETGKPLAKEAVVYSDEYQGNRLERAFDIRACKLGDGFVAAWRDVTDRCRMEADLRDSSDRYRLAVMAIDSMIYDWDLATQTVVRTDKLTQLVGYTPAEALPTRDWWTSLIHPDDLAAATAEVGEALAAGDRYTVEYRVRHRDGYYVYVCDQGVVVRDEAGTPVRAVGSTSDISDRRHHQQMLKARLDQQAMVAVLGRQALSGAEIDGLFSTVAQEVPRTLAVDFCSVLELKSLTRGFAVRAGHGLDATGAEQRMVEATVESQMGYTLVVNQSVIVADVEFETRFRVPLLPDVPPIASSLSVVIPGIDSQPFGVLCVQTQRRREFTRNDADFLQSIANVLAIAIERKQSEEMLRAHTNELACMTTVLARTNDELAERNRELNQFAYVASHDLKAPLRAIASLSEWIEEDLQDIMGDETRQQIHLLRSRVQRIENLINGLLQYARIGRSKTRPELVDVNTLLQEIVGFLGPPPGITVDISPNMPSFMARRWPLQQVFANLINNAIKHHNQSVGLVQISYTDRGDYFEFAVGDDGPGIAPEYHDKIFMIFQVLKARDKTENTGVGLSIVKKTVEVEGGSIYLESEVGAGSVFRFTWPKLPAP
ncbi:MAG: ATP-binding protein [Elainellaceae cyanobacterium]